MARIIPPDGELVSTAKVLLQLAGDVPEIVRTVSAGNEFEVPDELADAYHDAVTSTSSTTSKRRPARGKKE